MENATEAPSAERPWDWAIALDGGTTNTRARLVHHGQIVATARREVGVRDTVLGGRAGATLADAVREAVAEAFDVAREHRARPGRIVAAGMLSSEVGLATVPHVEAPAGRDELARAVVVHEFPEIARLPIAFVPGLRTPAADGVDGWMEADVMRGEECETLGALAELHRLGQLGDDHDGVVFVWPGSHTKLVEVDGRGRITRSHTSLAGEFLHAIGRHTLIAASLPENFPERLDAEAAEAGARAVERRGLMRAAFLVRLATLSRAMSPEERASFWIGAVVADDVRHLERHEILAPGRPIWVGGREPLRGLYARRLERANRGPCRALPGDLSESASAFGALEIVHAGPLA
jgi:2-dehydro-3-deoxygalactonokinase